VSAAELAANDALFSAAGDSVHVVPMSNHAVSRETVYNLEIAEFHTYFVGHHGVLVHNATTPGGGKPLPGEHHRAPEGRHDRIRQAGARQERRRVSAGWLVQRDQQFPEEVERLHSNQPDKQVGGEIHHVPAKDIYTSKRGRVRVRRRSNRPDRRSGSKKRITRPPRATGRLRMPRKYRQQQANLVARARSAKRSTWTLTTYGASPILPINTKGIKQMLNRRDPEEHRRQADQLPVLGPVTSMPKYVIDPHHGVGPFRFGMSRA
jgi:hypothetical protein